MVTIECGDRWQAYYRLQELELDCRCRCYEPLAVTVNTPREALLVWSVVQRVEGQRSELLERLERAWQLQQA